MGRPGDAVGNDVVGLAALGLPVEMHHLLGKAHVLRRQRFDDLVDMAVPDRHLLAVDDVLAVEHDAVAEAAAEPMLVRRGADHHQLAQRIDQRLRHGGRCSHRLDHLGHDRLDRQKGLALIELARCLERTDQRLAARVARFGDERVEVAVQHFEAERLVRRDDQVRNRSWNLDGEPDRIEPARLYLAR